MSRSRRKSWIRGTTTCRSEKSDKQLVNRRFRKISKDRMARGLEPLYDMDEISDIWNWGKDGKFRFDDPRLARK